MKKYALLMLPVFICFILGSCSSDQAPESISEETPPGRTADETNGVPQEDQSGYIRHFEGKTFESSEGYTPLPYRLYVPDEPPESLPLFIFLHGAGERGSDNERQLAYQNPFEILVERDETKNRFPCVIIAPQCPNMHWWGEQDILMSLLELIGRTADEYPVDKDRIYVTGLSMGGFGTFDLLAFDPDLFAAAVPICGGSDYESVVYAIKDTPVWAFHAADDDTVGVENTRRIARELEALGSGANFKYTEFETGGHAIWNRVYEDIEVFKWMFGQKKQ